MRYYVIMVIRIASAYMSVTVGFLIAPLRSVEIVSCRRVLCTEYPQWDCRSYQTDFRKEYTTYRNPSLYLYR